MSRRNPPSEPEIFNFSFLDILACTVGAIAFILTIILLNVSNSVDKSKVQKQQTEKLEELKEQLERVKLSLTDKTAERDQLAQTLPTQEERSRALASQSKTLQAEADTITKQARAAETAAAEVNKQAQETRQQLAEAQELTRTLTNQLNDAKERRQTMQAKLAEMQEQLEELRSKNAQNAEEYLRAVAVRDANRKLHTQLDAWNKRLDELRKQRESSATQIAAVDSLKEEEQRLQTAMQELTQALAEIRQLVSEAEKRAEAEPVASPPWWVAILLAVAVVALLIYWALYRAKLPRGSSEELKSKTEAVREQIKERQVQADQLNAATGERRDAIAANDDVQSLQAQLAVAESELAKANAAKEDARVDCETAQRELASVRSDKNTQRRKIQQAATGHAHVAPRMISGAGGAARTPTHVECTANGLKIHPDGTFVAQSGIENRRSAYGELLQELARQKKSRCLVLWIRPNGLDAFGKAREAAEERGIGVGWEPADGDWDFVF